MKSKKTEKKETTKRNKLINYDIYNGNKRSKYPGVYVREIAKGADISFVIRYRKNNKIKDVTIGKKSDEFTANKAKKILDEIKVKLRNNQDEQEIIDNISTSSKRRRKSADSSTKLSLNQLANNYFQALRSEAKKEENLEKSDKTSKDLNGIKKEESLYKNFWQYWPQSNIPFNLVSTDDFNDRIKELRNLRDEKASKNQVLQNKAKYSSKYIYNAVILIKSIISNTSCEHNPLDINNKNISSHDKKSLETLKNLYQLLKKDFRSSAPRQNSHLSINESNELLFELKRKKSYKQGYLMALIMLNSGMRPDSCLNLKIKDLNYETKLITTYDFKRKMNYSCILGEALAKELSSFIEDRDKDEYIFYSEHTQKIKKLPRLPRYISNVMNKLFNENRHGNDRIVPYSLRHTFATNLVKGVYDLNGNLIIRPLPLLQISKLLNHASVETTEKNYAHCTIHDSADSIQSFGEMLHN